MSGFCINDFSCVCLQKSLIGELLLWVGGWMDGWMDGWRDGWTDGRTDGRRYIDIYLDIYLYMYVCVCVCVYNQGATIINHRIIGDFVHFFVILFKSSFLKPLT